MAKKHKHVMLFGVVGEQSWFWCEVCPALVEIVPSWVAQGDGSTKITASARVRDHGWGGFGLEELASLARLWHAIFASFAARQQEKSRPTSFRRRRRSPARAA